jgi:hypothetical protein
MFLQQLWQLKVTWDEPLPPEFQEQWQLIQRTLPNIQNIQIDRLVNNPHQVAKLELHGFADASEAAYGACLYIRSVDIVGNITSKLLCSKSRVALLKKWYLPQLELCAAMLLAEMYQASSRALKTNFDKVMWWTDSMIVLAWLHSPAARWKTFVANRVNHIQETTNVDDWTHVRSMENPADLVSRGVDATILRNSSVWWYGPTWLQKEETSLPKCEPIAEISIEKKQVKPKNVVSLLIQTSEKVCTKFSSWSKLQRVLTYCLRFIHNCRHRSLQYQGALSPRELNETALLCVRHAQEEFSTLLCQVEAILNSRPLCPLSTNVENLQVLTPGHFLIGASLLALPDHHLKDVPTNRLSKWLCVQQMMQNWWRQWSQDYLHQLQQRNKWRNIQPNVEIGVLVLVKEDNLPPLVWKKAVISDLHPGKDGLIRVITLKTSTGTLKRPISKICLLPPITE